MSDAVQRRSEPSRRSPGWQLARTLESITAKVEPVARVVAGVGVLVLMLGTVVDVTLRTADGHGVPGVIEYTEVLLVVVVFLGLVTAARDGQHIRVGLLTERVPPRVAQVLRSLGLTISVGLVVWLIATTAIKAAASVRAGEYRFGLISVPVWPARVAIPIGLACLGLVLILMLVAQVTRYSTSIGAERPVDEDLIAAEDGRSGA